MTGFFWRPLQPNLVHSWCRNWTRSRPLAFRGTRNFGQSSASSSTTHPWQFSNYSSVVLKARRIAFSGFGLPHSTKMFPGWVISPLSVMCSQFGYIYCNCLHRSAPGQLLRNQRASKVRKPHHWARTNAGYRPAILVAYRVPEP